MAGYFIEFSFPYGQYGSGLVPCMWIFLFLTETQDNGEKLLKNGQNKAYF